VKTSHAVLDTRSQKELDAEMAEDLRDKRVQILKDSGTREEAICALRTLLSRALKDDEKRETILTKMEELRKSASDEQEDICWKSWFFWGLVQPSCEVMRGE
jgi:hypothetical protein